MIVDLVMWTKDGTKTLPLVLKRINEVIPEEFVNQRVIVDDHSTDDSKEIAKAFGWQVILNEGKGISDGANTALKQVTTDYFISFEQDLLLAKNWWRNIPALLKGKDVAVASGVRLPKHSMPLLKISEYALEKAKRLQFPFFKTLDNTIYKTNVIRKLGGFPKVGAGMIVDTVLARKIQDAGLRWLVDSDTVSTHLKTVLGEVKSQYFYGKHKKKIARIIEEKHTLVKTVARTAFSPIRGIQIARKKRCWQIAFIYPILRLASFFGVWRGVFLIGNA